MPSAAVRRVIWALAAVLLFAAGYVMLRACDLAIIPLYSHKYCLAPHAGALAAGRARMAQLQEELRQGELTFAQKPKCAPSQPDPRPQPQPGPQPDPQPQPPEQEKLKVPKKLSELQGCWESERGDLGIVTDDAEQRPVGKVRKCYCFGARGRGQLKMLYTNGVKCRAPVAARLEDGKLRMSYPRFGCQKFGQEWGLVPADIICENSEDPNGAICTTYGRGNIQRVTTEHYHRVEQDRCGD